MPSFRAVNFGVPEDIVRPYVSTMMRDFIDAYPAAGINLVSSVSLLLLKQFEEGRLDVLLTTEPVSTGRGECLYRGPLCWYAGRGSSVYDQRPLPLAAKPGCIFLPVATRALEQADIAWSLPYEATDWRDLTAFLSAGLAVETNMPYIEDIKDWERVPDSAGLPPLPISGYSSMSMIAPRRWPFSLPASSGTSISRRGRVREAAIATEQSRLK